MQSGILKNILYIYMISYRYIYDENKLIVIVADSYKCV